MSAACAMEWARREEEAGELTVGAFPDFKQTHHLHPKMCIDVHTSKHDASMILLLCRAN